MDSASVNGRANGAYVAATAVSVLLSEVEPELVRWLWAQRLPLGKFALVDGDPGLGKSTMLLDIAARVTRGDLMPDGSAPDTVGPAGVVLVQAEDGLADTIVPRLIAAGADRARIRAFTAVSEPEERDHEGLVRRPARNRMPHLGDMEQLGGLIADVSALLVIVDPLVAFLPPRVDSNKDSEVRQGLSGIVELAERLGCCVVGIRHLNKASALSALYRGGGSIGIIGAARSGLLVASEPDNPQRRVLAPLKTNLAVTPPSLAWRLESTAGGVAHVVWEGVTALTAANLLEGGDGDERLARSDAQEFLAEELAQGERAVDELMAAARRMGMSTRTVQRAAKELGVRKQRRGFGRGSEVRWSLSHEQRSGLGGDMGAPEGTVRTADGAPPTPRAAPSAVQAAAAALVSAEPLRVTCPKCGEPLGLDGTCALCDGVL